MSKIKVIKFYSKTCGPCKVMSSRLEELSKRVNIEIQSVNIADESNKSLIDKYSIISIPTIVIIKDNEELKIIKGIVPMEQLMQVING